MLGDRSFAHSFEEDAENGDAEYANVVFGNDKATHENSPHSPAEATEASLSSDESDDGDLQPSEMLKPPPLTDDSEEFYQKNWVPVLGNKPGVPPCKVKFTDEEY